MAQQATTFKLQQATNQPDEDLGTFTQNLLQQMREHMDSASRKMTARMAAAEKAAESLERELLALMEQAQQDAKL